MSTSGGAGADGSGQGRGASGDTGQGASGDSGQGAGGDTGQGASGGGGQPSAGEERMVLSPSLALLLGAVIAVFLAGTAYVSHVPYMHNNLALDALEGIVIGGAVGGIAGTRGLKLSERRERPAPGASGRRRRPR